MGFLLSRIFVFLTLTLVGSHVAALPLPPPQLYWNSVLPNTPMPKSIGQLVKPDFISVGKGGAILHNQVQKEENWVYSKDADENAPFRYSNGAAENAPFRYSNGAEENAPFRYSNGAAENAPFKYSNGADENAPFKYSNDAAENAPFCVKNGDADEFSDDASENVTRVEVDLTRTIFFLEKDLHPGTTMNYRLAGNSSSTTPFLSRKTVESIPFNSSKLPEILNKFSVKPESEAANMINNTIQDCELQGARNEAKQCVTSLESMIDFATSTLGKNVRAVATEMDKKRAAPIQKYTITTPGVTKLAGNKFMVCHKMSYVYAVFYCHAIEKTRTYMVPLQGADATKAKAVAACHEDTSEWNPNHYAFKELNVEPGTIPVCHFLKAEDVTWVPNQKHT